MRLIDAKSERDVLLHFRVTDTGMGIPADTQELIFEVFSQADNSSTRNFGGTGLGLTISSRLVKKIGGRIWVESVEGCGSTFHFTAKFEVAHKASFESQQVDISTLGGLSVLVVDDNARAERCSIVFAALGYEAYVGFFGTGRVRTD